MPTSFIYILLSSPTSLFLSFGGVNCSDPLNVFVLQNLSLTLSGQSKARVWNLWSLGRQYNKLCPPTWGPYSTLAPGSRASSLAPSIHWLQHSLSSYDPLAPSCNLSIGSEAWEWMGWGGRKRLYITDQEGGREQNWMWWWGGVGGRWALESSICWHRLSAFCMTSISDGTIFVVIFFLR